MDAQIYGIAITPHLVLDDSLPQNHPFKYNNGNPGPTALCVIQGCIWSNLRVTIKDVKSRKNHQLITTKVNTPFHQRSAPKANPINWEPYPTLRAKRTKPSWSRQRASHWGRKDWVRTKQTQEEGHRRKNWGLIYASGDKGMQLTSTASPTRKGSWLRPRRGPLGLDLQLRNAQEKLDLR